jgi:hypothetical protein
MHGLWWERVVDSPRLVFRFWYATEEEVRREQRHRRALERQARDHIRWVTSDRYRNKHGWRMSRQPSRDATPTAASPGRRCNEHARRTPQG